MNSIDEKLQPILAEVVRRNAGEPEFHQAVHEVLESLGRVVAKHPHYLDHALIGPGHGFLRQRTALPIA